MPAALILAGDVGGTKTALALFRAGKPGLSLVAEATVASADVPSAEAALEAFLDRPLDTPVAVACLGVAGPVVAGRVVATNLPWELSETSLAARLSIPRVRLINDLEATGHGVLALPASQLALLQVGTPRAGHRALIAAGTGLGEALLVQQPHGWHVIASEGGHVDFAPRTDLEIDLLRFLRKDFGRVSYERILSGPGFLNVYRFLRDTGVAAESEALRARLAQGDPAAVISELGMAGADPLCARTVEVFTSIYGAEAGNLALKALALGGVILGGGIAPRMLPALQAGGFMAAFRDKGRLSPLLEAMPVHVALDTRAPLLGAARVAAALLDAA